LAATMSSGVAVVVGRAGRATGGAESVDSLPPARAGATDGAAATGLVGRLGSADPGCFTDAGPVAAALWRVGGGGGGGLAGGRVELVIVGAVFADAVGGEGRWSAVVAPALAVRMVAAAPLLEPFEPDAPAVVCLAPEPLSAKKSRQMGSTLVGSARNCWYFSSTNQSLGPNSGTAADDTVGFRLFSNVKGGQSRLNLAGRPWSVGRRGVTHYPPSYYPVHVCSHCSGRRRTIGRDLCDISSRPAGRRLI